MVMTRSLLAIFALACVSGLPMQAADPMSSDLKQSYTAVKNNLIKMAEKMPEDQYGYKPVDTIRTFAQMVAHVADAQARMCSGVNGEMKSINAASKTTKADLVAALKESFDICDTAYNGLTDAKASEMVKGPRGERPKIGWLAYNLSHSNEEYGYMSIYLRMKGIVPPSSEPK